MKSQTLKQIYEYMSNLRVAFHDSISLLGFAIFLIIFNQLISGTMLSFSLITESMFIPLAREEEDAENLYTDDFFWLHERGVDLLVIFLFLHLFRKLYLNVMDTEQEFAWKSGSMLFLLIQAVIFSGLVLCCTHLSDITLVIAANALHTFCFFIGKLYWIFFTDQTLNSDTIIRLAYAHYTSAFIVAFLGLYHGVDMHYDWKNNSTWDGIKQELNWYDEALINEIGHVIEWLLLLGLLCVFLYAEPEALSYELFTWGDVGMLNEVRFYSVAPHWYFRPYMGWLISCPYHLTGLLGLVLFFISFYFQPNLVGRGELGSYAATKSFITKFFKNSALRSKYLTKVDITIPNLDIYYNITYSLLLVGVWYTFSYLPYGRFYNRLGGNNSTLLTYGYIYLYLSGLYLRVPFFYNSYKTLSY